MEAYLFYMQRAVVRFHYEVHMVIVAELVKHLIVVQEIVGSSPILHTTIPRGYKSWLEIYSYELGTLS